MLELGVGVVLAAWAVWFVLKPVLRPDFAGSATGNDGSLSEGEDPDDDLSPRAVALRALKEIEFDRATGKLDDRDYEALKAKYTGEAVAAMRAEPADGRRETGDVATATASSPVSRPSSPGCPEHGVPAEPGAQFCPVCGRRLAQAAGFCVRCGDPLVVDARFCNSCGSRVAA
ncbi:MAG TPA: zinc ribbon domain-containing protein [Gemmatimonadales bacterium]|nr:zinc ribbon domain-containing protein [Gemmatimonadales bacterium]